MNRFIEKYIIDDLKKKMVFLIGPRQVGKTWLAKKIAENYKNPLYLNYDNFHDRELIEEQTWLDDVDLIIFDEIHKKNDWKNYLKGIYDTNNFKFHILVTGSARLDTFKRTGDSLAGRYFPFRLMPFSLFDIKNEKKLFDINKFMQRGGFPEPFLSESDIDALRWRNQYSESLVRKDVLDFESIHDIKAINLVFELLRHRVGSPISYSSIARDVNISPTTVIKYIDILEALFIVFKVTPYSRNIARSILKEPKIYFFDTGLVEADQGKVLENFVAVSLLTYIYYSNDLLGKNMDLHYLRTKDGKEVDFCITDKNVVQEILEIKLSETSIDSNLLYFSNKYGYKARQLVKNIRLFRKQNNIEVLSIEKYLNDLVIDTFN